MKKLNDKLLEKEDELGRLKEKHKKAIGVWEEKSNQLKKVSRTVIGALFDSLFTSWLWYQSEMENFSFVKSWYFTNRKMVSCSKIIGN